MQSPAGRWWVNASKRFTCVLPLTYQQCSNHCQSSRVAHGASKQRWVTQTNRDTPKVWNPSINETELSGRFNHKSHSHMLLTRILPNSTWTLTNFSYMTENLRKYLMENAACFADRQNIYAGRYRSADQRLRTIGLESSFQRLVCNALHPSNRNDRLNTSRNCRKIGMLQNGEDEGHPTPGYKHSRFMSVHEWRSSNEMCKFLNDEVVFPAHKLTTVKMFRLRIANAYLNQCLQFTSSSWLQSLGFELYA